MKQKNVHFKSPPGIPEANGLASGSHGQHAYLIVLVLVGDLERVHGSDHSLHGREDVLIHQLGEAPFVFIRVSRPVDDSHLLDERTLATLSSP